MIGGLRQITKKEGNKKKKIKKEEEENRFVDKHRLTSTIVRSGELCCREAASSLACGIQPALRRRPMNSSRTSAS